MARLKKDNKWGFADKTGKVVVPVKFDAVLFYSEGFTSVKTKGKFGFINKAGEFITEPKYDEAESFILGMAKVRKGKKWGGYKHCR